MEFKIITIEDLRESVSNLLMHHFPYKFSELNKTIFLEITESQFAEFKNRPITEPEMIGLIGKTKIDADAELKRIKSAWQINEKRILESIKDKTGISISTEGITCSIDPYTSHGFYGEDNISIGTGFGTESDLMVIAHELFHIFYWKNLKQLGLFDKDIGQEEFWEWALAEVTVYLLQKDLQALWPNTPIELYPDIKETFEKVRDLWKTESFDNFLKKSYSLLNPVAQ